MIRISASLLSLLLLAALAASAAAQSPDPLARTGRWLDASGELLPFADDREVVAFLETAEPIASEVIAGSSSRPLKVLLEKDGVRAHAIFRTVDVERDKLDRVAEHARGFRDSYLFEVAAYELSRLLGLDNVPPAVVRTLGRERGSMQLWVEHAMGVQERIEHGIRDEHAQLWQFQKQNMHVFDVLIYNFDRNPGNMLIDSAGKLWFVDHTRSFKILPTLDGSRTKIQVLERRFWERLRDLDPETVRAALDPYLRRTEIDALLQRQKKLVRFLDKRIARHGEQAILFEFVAAPAAA